MRRRDFIAGLAAALGTTSYFDMGGSWKKHGDLYHREYTGIWTEACSVNYLKEHYSGKRVSSLIFASPRDLFAGIPRT